MYREKIREYYDHLSRSYRKVADFILSNYYEVSFMTAAQLAYAVGVDTTTVVRFSQRLGYNGYPELLHDIREQVKGEIYSAYVPQVLTSETPAGIFSERAEQERSNLSRMLIHNPPEVMDRIAQMLARTREVVLVAEGYALALAELTAQQLRQHGIPAHAPGNDPAHLAGTLSTLAPDMLVTGVSVANLGRDVARALSYARARGCSTLGIVGASPARSIACRTRCSMPRRMVQAECRALWPWPQHSARWSPWRGAKGWNREIDSGKATARPTIFWCVPTPLCPTMTARHEAASLPRTGRACRQVRQRPRWRQRQGYTQDSSR